MRIKIANRKLFWFAIVFSFFLVLSYFIPIRADTGANYYVTDTLLGILINHNAVALAVYVLIATIVLAASVELHEKR